MKLRNKKTGEIKEVEPITIGGFRSIAELNEEWEDYKEPKKHHYYIETTGRVIELVFGGDVDAIKEELSEIGNYFETKEEAEKAVEKLKAWKRLKDKGFKFKDFGRLNDCATFIRATHDESWSDLYDDLNLLFGGE